MRCKILLTLGTVLAALSTGLLTGTASASNGYTCGASQLFASLGDTAAYIQMSAAGNDNSGDNNSGNSGDGDWNNSGSGNSGSGDSGPSHHNGSTAFVFRTSCTRYLQPSLRVITQDVGDPVATLTVSVQFRDSTGYHNETVGTLSGSAQMQVSPILFFHPAQLSGIVQVTLTPSGPTSDWLIGGVYIDPFCAR